MRIRNTPQTSPHRAIKRSAADLLALKWRGVDEGESAGNREKMIQTNQRKRVRFGGTGPRP